MKSFLKRMWSIVISSALVFALAGCITVVEAPAPSISETPKGTSTENAEIETQQEYLDRISSNILYEVASCSPNAVVYVTNHNDENVDVFVQVAWIHGDGVVADTAASAETLVAGLTSKVYVPIPASVGSYGECQVVSIEPWSE
jgi:hypothetical protein